MKEHPGTSDHTLGFTHAKFGYVALCVFMLELTVIWGGVGMLQYATRLVAPKWLLDIFALAYFAGLLAIVVSIVGLFRDRTRLIAFLALFIGILTTAVCTIPLAV